MTLRPSANLVVKAPLFGILHREVTAKQVLPVMASPFTCPHLPSLTCYRREKSTLLTKLRFLLRTKVY